MRELKRNMARENMKKYGITRINKKRRYYSPHGKEKSTSFFSQNWRRWIYGVPARSAA